MKTIIYGRDKDLIAWAEERIHGCRFRDDAYAIGLAAAEGEIIASTVFDTFSTTSCFVSVAANGRNWLSKPYLYHCFAYPFIQCRFPRINCVISEHNEASLRFTRKIGWVQEGVVRQGGSDGEDLIFFGMLRRECRWLPKTLLTTA